MRLILIDTNELKKTMPKFILEEAEVYIDETEEIEAIPIWWIKQWIWDNDERYRVGVQPVRDLLKDWCEKEYEKSEN